MSGRTWLALGILVWTAVTWGGRVRLLTGAEQGDLGTWLRVGGSIVVGVAAATVIAFASGGSLERWVLTLFALWSTVVWLRSLITVWLDDGSVPFKLVHTVLAAGFLLLAFLAVRLGWAPRT